MVNEILFLFILEVLVKEECEIGLLIVVFLGKIKFLLEIVGVLVCINRVDWFLFKVFLDLFFDSFLGRVNV